jgi:hypothetical protein
MRERKRFGYADTRSVGAAIWEATHPDQVRAESRALGLPEPSYADILSGAADDAITAARESVANVQEAAGNIATEAVNVGKLALVAIIVAGVVYLMDNKEGRR